MPGTGIRFAIRPDGGQDDGLWRWETYLADGRRRSTGVAESKKLAAALVIRDICAAARPEARAAS